jgi:hypothetical protein
MPKDKQLRRVNIDEVVEKRRLDQALNAKEFAVLAGISYSTAREWFRLPGFPVFRGVVFWQDFERWRAAQTGLGEFDDKPPRSGIEAQSRGGGRPATDLPPQAARIVAEFG